MKRVLFSLLFLLHISIVKTMDQGLPEKPGLGNNDFTHAHSNSNESIVDKLKAQVLAFKNLKPRTILTISGYAVGTAWAAYMLIGEAYLRSVIVLPPRSKSSRMWSSGDYANLEAFLEKTDHSKFKGFMNAIFLKPLTSAFMSASLCIIPLLAGAVMLFADDRHSN